MLKRIWARGISFCLISAEKRQVSQKKISEKAPNQLHYPHLSIPSQLYPSASREYKPVIFWMVSYGVYYDSPSCILCNGACDWACSQLSCSLVWKPLWNPLSKWESFLFGPPITHFCPNVKGFFAFFALFFWVFFLTFHVEPVILAM